MLGVIGSGNLARALVRGWGEPVLLTDSGSGRARELAAEAAGIDNVGRSAQVQRFLGGGEDEEADAPAPSREDVEAALQASQEEHRRMHAEDSRFGGE